MSPINLEVTKPQPLHNALANGSDIATLKQIIKHHPSSIHDKNMNGSLPLHKAIALNRPDIVSLLLSQGSSLNYQNAFGSPLHLAVSLNNVACLRLLLEANIDTWLECVTARDSLGRSLIEIALGQGSVPCLKMLLSYNVPVPDDVWFSQLEVKRKSDKQTLECAKLLIDHGVDLEKPYGTNPSVVHYFFMSMQTNLVKYALERAIKLKRFEEGVSSTEKGKKKAFVAWTGDESMLINRSKKCLLNGCFESHSSSKHIYNLPSTAVHTAVRYRDENLLSLLIEANYPVAEGCSSQVPEQAVVSSSREREEILCDTNTATRDFPYYRGNGTDLFLRNPASLAIQNDDWDILHTLLAKGRCDPNSISNHLTGDTLLHYAVARRAANCAIYLFLCGADPFKTNFEGKACLELESSDDTNPTSSVLRTAFSLRPLVSNNLSLSTLCRTALIKSLRGLKYSEYKMHIEHLRAPVLVKEKLKYLPEKSLMELIISDTSPLRL